ncbi:sacsin-like [Convolutriloba macropyga]|uniref:sacsin-like n=1 Tax=Convolutriloba macropyga TaxID=536237 RepID=UPI003F51F7C2
MKLFKLVPARDVIENWKMLVEDRMKSFREKCQEIYAILLYVSENFSGSDVQYVSKFLEVNEMLPISDDEKFCSKNNVSVDQKCAILNGHFHHLNSSLIGNSELLKLFKRMRLAECFTTEQYIKVVNNLSSLETEIQVRQLRAILETLRERDQKCSKLPDNNGEMKSIFQLCLDDFKLRESLTELKPVYCHRVIPHDLAQYFGVKTKRSKLEELSRDLLFENFSQQQDLCSRLKRITENYSSSMDVFKELIQNADDAKASEIHFILDQRNLAKSRVVNENWEKLLDPALLVFNDAFFTSQDIAGIKDLGKGSKGTSDDKIGQFGVGFNCVYTLTDFPCFLTQVDGKGMGNLCLFDPTCQIAPGYGKKININADLLKNFQDSFGCFLMEDSEFDATKGKTMFRLPLRQQKSQLAEQLITVSQLEETLNQLRRNIPSYLLFLKSVRKISISHIDHNKPVTTLRSVSKQVIESSGISWVSIFDEGLNPQIVSKWVVSEKIGSDEPSPVLVTNNPSRYKFVKKAAVAYNMMPDTDYRGISELVARGVWCYLPLEEYQLTGGSDFILPLAVNAPFLLDDARRLLTLKSDEIRGAWNCYLLEHIVGGAYAALVKNLIANEIMDGKESHEYFSMFPSVTKKDSLSFLISRGLHKGLSDQRWIPSLAVDKTIVSFHKVTSVKNFEIKSPTNINEIIYKVCLKLCIPLTQIEEGLEKSLKLFGIQLSNLDSMVILQNLSERYKKPTHIKETVFETRQILVTFLNWSAEALENHEKINSLPVFLSADGKLQKNDERNKLYSSKLNVVQIFPGISHRVLDALVEKSLNCLKVTCELSIPDFFEFMRRDFGYLFSENAIKLDNCPDIDLKWIENVWDYLANHEKQLLTDYGNVLDKLAILLCCNKNKAKFLLPVNLGKKWVLESFQPIKIGALAVNWDCTENFYEIDKCLKSDHKAVERKAFVKQFIIPQELTVEHQVQILNELNEENGLKMFSHEKKKQLYTYVRDSYKNDRKCFQSTDIFEKVKSLPIFTFASSEVKSLTGEQEVWAIPRNIPNCDELFATQNCNCVERERDVGLDFQKKLGIVIKSVVDIYKEVIIPQMFPKFGQVDDLKTHLTFLGGQLSRMGSKEKDLIRSALMRCRFIPNEMGELLSPDQVYQIEVEPLIGYVSSTFDFSSIGVLEKGQLNSIVPFYKPTTASDVITNWLSLVEDSSKDFSVKCERITQIIYHLCKKHPQSSQDLKNRLRYEALLPTSVDGEFVTSSSLCIGEKTPLFQGHLHRINSQLTNNNDAKKYLINCGITEQFSDEVYCNLINSLTELKGDGQISELIEIMNVLMKLDTIARLPDTELVMRPVGDLCFNDYKLKCNIMERSLIFCHEKLPFKLCHTLRVKTKREKILELSCDARFQPFSHQDDTVPRLAKIAENYSNCLDIFKELIQNADEAQASEIHFILDERNHPKKSLVNDGWENLLNPALLVFNNSCFTSSDLAGLETIGRSSKINDVDKIGQFGIGFNSVYRLTDFPSILTQLDGKGGGNLVLLDPLRVVSERGGVCMSLNDDNLSNFPDTFGCYLRERPDFNARVAKTILRLPFRTCKSKLGKPMEVMQTDLEQLSFNIPKYLLFLNNVKRVKVSRITDSGSWVNVSSHRCKISENDLKKIGIFKNSCAVLHDIRRELVVDYNVDIYDEEKDQKVSSWIVFRKRGAKNVNSEFSDNCAVSDIKRLKPEAAVAYPTFLDDSLELNVFGIWRYLPIDDVRAHINPCLFLRVAINAPFQLDYSHKLPSVESCDPKGRWNAFLLKEIVGAAYASLVQNRIKFWSEDKSSFSFEKFAELFPNAPSQTTGQSRLKCSQLSSLIVSGLQKNLLHIKSIPVTDFDGKLRDFEVVGQVKQFDAPFGDELKDFTIFKIAENLGFKMTRFPEQILAAIKFHGLKVNILKPIDFIQKLSLQYICPIEIENSVFSSPQNLAIFIDWILDVANEDSDCIHMIPIYLTADNVIQQYTGQKFFSSDYVLDKIFPSLENRILNDLIEERLRPFGATHVMLLPEFLSHLEREIAGNARLITFDWILRVWTYIADQAGGTALRDVAKRAPTLPILPCEDNEGQTSLQPLCAAFQNVFLKFPLISIGTVQIDTRRYNQLLQIQPSFIHHSLTLKEAFAQLVLSDHLTVVEQVNILHLIKEQILLTDNEKSQLYNYFSDKSALLDKSSLEKLREIPIFKTISGELECLPNTLSVISVPWDVPKEGFKAINCKFVPLDKTEKGQNFQQILGIAHKSVEQLYESFIIPQLHCFDWEDLEPHLKFLTTCWQPMALNTMEKGLIKNSLQLSPFIENSSKQKFRANAFLNPNCDLFEIFQAQDLLPEKFIPFIPLLSQIGLRMEVNRNDFWNFLKRYASHAPELGSSVFGLLIIEFRKLGFLPSDFERVGTFPVFETVKHGYRTLTEIFFFEYHDLVELVAPVLVKPVSDLLKEDPIDQSEQSFRKMWVNEKSRITQPSVSLVFTNLKSLTKIDGLKNNNKISACVKFIVDEELKHDSTLKSISELSKFACIRSSSGKFLPPRQICKVFKCHLCETPESNCYCGMKDYVDEPGDDFLQIWKELEAIGATKTVSLQQVVYAIENFHRETSIENHSLKNPILRSKFEHLYDHFRNASNNSEHGLGQLNESCPVYLRTKTATLQNANTCIVIDDSFLFSKLTESSQGQTEIISECEVLDLVGKEALNLKLLPPALRPKFLKDICFYKIDQRTFAAANSASDLFLFERAKERLSDNSFLAKLADVIANKRRILERREGFSSQEEPISIDESSLQNLKTFRFMPVQKLIFCFTLETNNQRRKGSFQKEFDYEERNYERILHFTFNDNLYNGSKTNTFVELTAKMFQLIAFEQDSKVVEVIAKMIFSESGSSKMEDRILEKSQSQQELRLAQHWLKQAQGYFDSLKSLPIAEKIPQSCRFCVISIGLKVTENSLIALIALEDGSSAEITAEHSSEALSPIENTLKLLEELRSKTNIFNRTLAETESTLHSSTREFSWHQSQQITPQFLKQIFTCATKTFNMAKNAISMR